MRAIRKAILIVMGSISFVLGLIGAFVPVLPTTPLMLLAAFLYSRSSEHLDAWLRRTRVYRSYVDPFMRGGGLPLQRKTRIISISYLAMGASALLVRQWIVWIVLAAVAIFLLILMFVKIPTIPEDSEQEYRLIESETPVAQSETQNGKVASR